MQFKTSLLVCMAMFLGCLYSYSQEREEIPDKRTQGIRTTHLAFDLVRPTDGTIGDYRYFFTNRFEIALERNLHPMRYMERVFDPRVGYEGANEKIVDAVADSATEALKYGGEEILFRTSLKVWLDDWSRSILKRVIGNTDERYIELDAGQSLARMWFDQAGTFDYGIRPFQMDPYGFVTFAPKNRFGERMFRLHSRIYMRNFNSFSAESFLFFSLIEDWRIGISHIYRDPSYHREVRDANALALALRREFSSGSEVLISFGDSTLGGTRVFLGYAKGW